MNKDRIKGAAQKIKGGIEKAVGRLTGNKKLELDSKLDTAVALTTKAAATPRMPCATRSRIARSKRRIVRTPQSHL